MLNGRSWMPVRWLAVGKKIKRYFKDKDNIDRWLKFFQILKIGKDLFIF